MKNKTKNDIANEIIRLLNCNNNRFFAIGGCCCSGKSEVVQKIHKEIKNSYLIDIDKEYFNTETIIDYISKLKSTTVIIDSLSAIPSPKNSETFLGNISKCAMKIISIAKNNT